MADREPLLANRKGEESRSSAGAERNEKQDTSHKPIHPIRIVGLVILGLIILTARMSFGLWKDDEPTHIPDGSPKPVDDFKDVSIAIELVPFSRSMNGSFIYHHHRCQVTFYCL
jgi:hypothetical protein